MVSPLMLQIAIHYRTRVGDYQGFTGDGAAHANSPAVEEAINWFIRNDLIEPAPCGKQRWQQTTRLGPWVEAICNVPLPVREWRIPWEQVIHTKVD